MSIANRDLDPSERVLVYDQGLGAVATAVTNIVAVVPFSCQVVAASLKAFGLSGSPVYSLAVLRPTPTGFTNLGLGATVTGVEGATSAYQGFSLTLGATQLLQTGDCIALQSGAANTASASVLISVVVKALQDIKTYWGASIS